MKLEDICTSQELSKKLKEAGYPQDTYFNWVSENWIKDDWEERIEVNDYDFDCPIKVIASAPTVAELGEALPLDVRTSKWELNPTMFVIVQNTKKGSKGFYEQSEADVRAQMWLYLKKKGLL